MKKTLFTVLLLISTLMITACSGTYIRDADDGLSKKEKDFAILVFSTTFKENGIQELPLFIDLEGEKGGSQELRLDPDEDKIHVFLVKAGYYRLKDMNGENNSPALTRTASDKEKREIYTDKEWGFEVKAGTTTYAGNFWLKNFDHKEGLNTKFYVKQESYIMSADIAIRQRFADIQRVLEENPDLKKYKFPIKIALMQEVEGGKSRIQGSISAQKRKQQNQGYGNFKWGISVEEVKSILDAEKKPVIVVNQEQLVDNSRETAPVSFFFESDKNGGSQLKKVQVSFPATAFDKVFASLLKKYGTFAKKEEGKTIWFTPYTRLSLESGKENGTLTYEAISLKKKSSRGGDDFVK